MCLPAYVLFFFVFLLFCTLSGFPLGKFARAFGAAMGEAEETGGGKTFFEKRKKKKKQNGKPRPRRGFPFFWFCQLIWL